MKLKLSVVVFSIITVIMLTSLGWTSTKNEEELNVIYISTEEYMESSGLVLEPEIKVDEPTMEFYDIPLNEDIQEYTITLSEQYNIPHELVFALMDVESSFRTDLISGTNDFGIMQINKINHKRLSEELGVTNFLDPKQNIESGVFMISELYHKYDGDLHKSLTAYNRGEGGMRKLWKNGTRSSIYSRKVVEKYKTYSGTSTDS